MIHLKTLLRISLRNVFRNSRRTLLTLSILILGCGGLIVIGGFFENIMEGFREQFIHTQTGHLQVSKIGYQDKGASEPFQYMIRDITKIKQVIESQPHVLYTVPRLRLMGMASSEQTSIAVMALGTDPALDAKMGCLKADNSSLPSFHIVAGKDLDPGDPYGVVIGKGLMKALDLKVGDSLSFITTREGGALDGADFTIRGAFETIIKEFDDRALKMNLKTAQGIMGESKTAHTLLVLIDETKNTDLVARNLKHVFANKKIGMETFTWFELGHFYRKSKDLLNKIYHTIQLVICIIFFFSIANTLNMSLFERMREFGTMMALGDSRHKIFGMIISEALFIGLAGSVLGVAFGIGCAALISAIGIQMPPPPNGTVPYIAMISITPRLLVETFLISIFSTLLASLIPAYRAAHFRIIAALGYV